MATDETIIQQGRVLNAMGDTIRLFHTFDGKWYRVRTNFETFTKVRLPEKAAASFSELNFETILHDGR